MTQNEREQLEVLLRKQLGEQPETVVGKKNCPDPDLVSAYLEGSLSPTLKTALESHVSECRRCQEELAFLLKTFPAGPVKETQGAPKLGNKLLDWLGLRRIGPVFLKPVFAIVVVAVLSGVVGYKIIFEHRPAEEKVTQIADSMAKHVEVPAPEQAKTEDREKGTVMNTHPALEARQPDRRPASVVEKPRLDQIPRATNKERRYSAPQEVESPLSKDDSRNGRTEGIREEPTNQLREKEPQRKDLNDQPAATPQVAAAPAAPPPASAPALNRVMAERDSGAKEQQSIQDKKVAGQLQAGKEATGQLIGSGGLARKAVTTKQKPNVSDEAALASKTEESKGGISSAEAVGGSTMQLRLIRLSGKTFELRQKVWVDLAIGKEEKYVPIVIPKNSQDFVRLEKELSAYQDVLDRPEDCLIKLNEHIYRIQKK